MEMPAGYWQEIRDNCNTILQGLPTDTVQMLPLVRSEWSLYEWPGKPGENVALYRLRDRLVPIGNWSLASKYFYNLELSDDIVYRELWFDPAEERVLSALHGFNNRQEAGTLRQVLSGIHKGRYRRNMWPFRPKDYERLYEELGRGAIYRLTELDNN